MASLYDRYDLYDLVAPRDAAMEAFYVSRAQEAGRRVLDLACGTGRLTIPLARAGLEVAGIDSSAAMLARAQQMAAEHGLALDTHQLDIRDFELGQQFETVMIVANSIAHLLTSSDFERFFRSVARHLAPGGLLLFDCFVPSMTLLSQPGARQNMTTAVHPTLGEITVEEIIDYDSATQVAETTWFWSTASEDDFHVTDLALRSIFPQELPLLLQVNGFTLIERFGDFDESPLSPSSHRQVCVCVRDDSP